MLYPVELRGHKTVGKTVCKFLLLAKSIKFKPILFWPNDWRALLYQVELRCHAETVRNVIRKRLLQLRAFEFKSKNPSKLSLFKSAALSS